MPKRPGRFRSRGARRSRLAATAGDGNPPRNPERRVAPARRGDAIHCALCERVVEQLTVHHLVPRAHGGNHGPTARLCPTCHRQVHALFATQTLAEELYSVELLQANPQVAVFLCWMRKQRATAFRVRRARQRG